MAYTNFKPTIWSESIQRTLERDCLFHDAVSHEFQGEAKRGATVQIPFLGRPTIGNYEGTDIAPPENVSDDVKTLLIDQAKFFNIGVSKCTDHNTMEITAQHVGSIGNGFSSADLHFSLIKIKRIAAKFADTDLERYTGTGG